MIYLIRHAQSAFNLAQYTLQKSTGPTFSKKSPQFLQLKFHHEYADCGLTEAGRQQCLETRQKLKDVKIDLVLVSPMRRALQTCHIIFEGHKHKPKVLVDPGVREIFSSSCDIGSRLRQALADFPDYDYSLVKNFDYWYIDSIKNQQIRQLLLHKLNQRLQTCAIAPEDQNSINKIAVEIMLEYLRQAYGKIDHTSHADFQGQKQRIRQFVKQYGNVAVVSHHDNIYAITGRKVRNAEVVVLGDL